MDLSSDLRSAVGSELRSEDLPSEYVIYAAKHKHAYTRPSKKAAISRGYTCRRVSWLRYAATHVDAYIHIRTYTFNRVY